MYGPLVNTFGKVLAKAISWYMGTTRMVGSMWEYRNSGTGSAIGFAHKVAKGRMLRGQRFYCNNDGAMQCVWFHSMRDLVCRAIKDNRINVVDLGLSGSDVFTELKMKYGFDSVVDLPAAADYIDDFIYEEHQNEGEAMGDEMIRMIEALTKHQAAREAKLDDKD